MADILASVAVAVGAELSGFDRGMAQVKKELGGLVKLGERMQSFGKNLSAAVTAPLLALGGLSVKMAGDMEKAKVNFEVMLGSAEKAGKVLGDLKQFAASTPFEFPEVQDAAKKLLAFGTPAEEVTGTLRQLGDVAAGIDAPIGEIAEIFGKARVQGRLFGEDINQLTGRGIPVIQEFAKQFKVSESEVKKLVETGKIGFPQLQQAFASLTGTGGQFAGLMEKQSRTLPGLFSTASDVIKGFAADIGADLAETFNLKGALTGFSSFLENLRASFAELDPSVKKIIFGVTALAAAIGPLSYGIGTLLTALPAIKLGFAALTGPIGLTVAAVVAAGALIVANWDRIREYFTTGPGAATFKALVATTDQVLGEVKAIFTSVVGELQALWEQFGPTLTAVAAAAFDNLRAVFGAAFTILGDIFIVFAKFFRGDWEGLWNGLKKLGADALNAITSIVSTALAGILNISSKLAGAFKLNGLSGALSDASAFVRGLGQELQIATGTTQQTATATVGLAGALAGLLAPAAAAAQAVVGMSEEQKKALQGLREALRDNERLSQALGDSYDYVGGKSKALEGGIQSLVKAGFDPAGRTVQGFVAQLRAIPGAIENIQASTQGIKLDFRTDGGTSLEKLQAGLGKFGEGLPASLPAYQTAVTAYSTANQQLGDSFGRLTTLLVDIGPALAQGLATITAGAAEAFGATLVATGDLGSALEATFDGILKGMADFAIQFGQLLIAQGTAALFAKTQLATNPAGAIAAGAFLVAAGAAAGALLKKGPNLSGGGTSRVSSGGSVGNARPLPSSSTPTSSPVTVNHEVQVVVSGNQLIGVLNIQQTRNGVVTGRRP